MIPGLPLWVEIHYDFGDDFSQQDRWDCPWLFFLKNLGLPASLRPSSNSGPLWALLGPSSQLPLNLWAPLVFLLRPTDDVGLKLAVEKVKDAIGTMPQTAVGNKCYEWGRDRISRGRESLRGFWNWGLKRHLGGPQSSRRASVWVSKSAERASQEAETASIAAGRASEATGRALGNLGVPQRQLGGPWEGRGAETIMKMKATK